VSKNILLGKERNAHIALVQIVQRGHICEHSKVVLVCTYVCTRCRCMNFVRVSMYSIYAFTGVLRCMNLSLSYFCVNEDSGREESYVRGFLCQFKKPLEANKHVSLPYL
jgi:hypothetical protein